MVLSLEKSYRETLDILGRGGCVIYPTETLYALGAAVTHEKACTKILHIKNRSHKKPFPVIIGDRAQVQLFTPALPALLKELTQKFWPGPLSLLMQSSKKWPLQIQNDEGFVCVRLTSHPLAAQLCQDLDTALIATSANKSGLSPTASPRNIDLELLQQTSGILTKKPWPCGGAPSTIVAHGKGNKLMVLRQGAITKEDLLKAGFQLDF